MNKRVISLIACLCFAISFTVISAQTGDLKEQPRRITIKAGRSIDTKAGAITKNAFILIEGDKIAAVGPKVAVPAEIEVIDLKDKTVLPGLIDCHTHITSQPGNYYEDIFRKSPIDVAVTAHVYARRTLEAGFTTVRDVGAGEFIDVALRNAINRG